MECPQSAGLAFNIGNPQEITIDELAVYVCRAVGTNTKITHIPYKQAYGDAFEDTRRRMPDATRSAQVLGFRATTTLEAGLRQTIQWFKEHHNDLIPS